MNRIIFRLRYSGDADYLAELSWTGGHTRIISAADTLRPELERFVDQGLSEWIGPPEDPEPRTTPSSDQLFLSRLASYLRRQFNFIVELQEDESQLKKRDTTQWPPRKGVPVRQPALASQVIGSN